MVAALLEVTYRFGLQEAEGLLNVAPVLEHSAASLTALPTRAGLMWGGHESISWGDNVRRTHQALAAHHLQQVQQPGAVPEVLEQVQDHARRPPLSTAVEYRTNKVELLFICGGKTIHRLHDRMRTFGINISHNELGFYGCFSVLEQPVDS